MTVSTRLLKASFTANWDAEESSREWILCTAPVQQIIFLSCSSIIFKLVGGPAYGFEKHAEERNTQRTEHVIHIV